MVQSPDRAHFRGRRARRAAAVVLTAAALALGAGAAWWATHPLLEVAAPPDQERVGLEGVEVLVRFARERVEAATFRVLLNGADVTGELEVATNGASGRLVGLLDGPNHLRFEVFGRSPWPPGLLVEEGWERVVWFRRPLGTDRG